MRARKARAGHLGISERHSVGVQVSASEIEVQLTLAFLLTFEHSSTPHQRRLAYWDATHA